MRLLVCNLELPHFGLVEFIVFSFAIWRVASLLTNDEDGPFDILHKIRYWVGVRYDEYGKAYGNNELAKIFTCIWCMSIWLGFGIIGIYLNFPTSALWLFGYPLGVAGAIILLQRLIRG